MASIDRGGRRVRWVDPTTKRKRCRVFPTPAAARVFAAGRDKDDELVKLDYLNADDLSKAQKRQEPIAVLVEDYAGELERRRTTAAYRVGQIAAVNRFVAEERLRTVQDFDVRAADHFLRGIAAAMSARTHNHYRTAIGGFGRWLEGHRYLDRNPVFVIRGLDQNRDKRRPSRALTVAETDSLIAGTIDPTRQALYLLRVRTGVRVREASRLLWGDLDGDVLTLRAEMTKSGRADRAPLPADVIDLILSLQRDAFKAGRPVQQTDPMFGPPPCRRTWYQDLERAEVKRQTTAGQADPKCLRPTFNSHLERAGVDLTLTGLLMRHTPAGGLALTLGTYGDQDALLDRKRQAVRVLSEWIESQRAKATAAIG